MDERSMPDEALELCRQIAPLLAGKPANLQGAVLADLLAVWLAGHIAAGDARETDRLRENLLAMHLEYVRQLVPINAEAIHGKTQH
jgi:hypothetical protein